MFFLLLRTVLPIAQTLKAPVSQSSTVCTPSDMMTATIPQNEKTVSESK